MRLTRNSALGETTAETTVERRADHLPSGDRTNATAIQRSTGPDGGLDCAVDEHNLARRARLANGHDLLIVGTVPEGSGRSDVRELIDHGERAERFPFERLVRPTAICLPPYFSNNGCNTVMSFEAIQDPSLMVTWAMM